MKLIIINILLSNDLRGKLIASLKRKVLDWDQKTPH